MSHVLKGKRFIQIYAENYLSEIKRTRQIKKRQRCREIEIKETQLIYGKTSSERIVRHRFERTNR